MVFDHELLFSIKALQFGFYLTLLPYLQHRVAAVTQRPGIQQQNAASHRAIALWVWPKHATRAPTSCAR